MSKFSISNSVNTWALVTIEEKDEFLVPSATELKFESKGKVYLIDAEDGLYYVKKGRLMGKYLKEVYRECIECFKILGEDEDTLKVFLTGSLSEPMLILAQDMKRGIILAPCIDSDLQKMQEELKEESSDNNRCANVGGENG